MIEDLGSANGTFVNGTRINAPQVLSPGAGSSSAIPCSKSLPQLPDRTRVTPSAPGAGATRIAAIPPVEPAASPAGR